MRGWGARDDGRGPVRDRGPGRPGVRARGPPAASPCPLHLRGTPVPGQGVEGAAAGARRACSPPTRIWGAVSGIRRAARAVGTANGANPISYLIPCHRAIRKSGHLGGYRWGLGRKLAMLTREAGGLTFSVDALGRDPGPAAQALMPIPRLSRCTLTRKSAQMKAMMIAKATPIGMSLTPRKPNRNAFTM